MSQEIVIVCSDNWHGLVSRLEIFVLAAKKDASFADYLFAASVGKE
jgi:hypothetical protein